MKSLVIIPAYNESENIKNTVQTLMEKAPQFDYVVVNDHSKDDTLKILQENHINYINLPTNLGIGGAVQTGYQYAYENGYDMAVQVDGDGQHDPAYLNQLVETMQKEDADMVIGSRFINKEGFQSTFARRVGINYFSHLIKQLTGKTITDPTSGFRLANRRVIALFAQDYPRDYPEPESIVALLKRGLKVVEAPVVMKERQGGQSSIRLQNSIYYMIKVTIAILIENMRKY
ncbi:MAG: glycosyltransferase family 2 protein [Erysipelotrichaceae bacterium]|nr:glycosyltransferase family 2 protein [Erysipelotrichaceae bacterium]MCH4044072.1 glycosyltransferase family 2 protein [Erysipelotrichaceae bacterium]MCH4121287.1 glycosyltransferase family 2 protein [Erysipelotrichaceae bacterium]